MKLPCTHVYVMSGGGRSKVGVSGQLEKRFQILRREGAEKIEKTWHRPKDARKVESAAIAILYNGEECPSERREWFDATVQEAIEAVEKAIAIVEAGGRRPKYKLQKQFKFDPEALRRALDEYNRQHCGK